MSSKTLRTKLTKLKNLVNKGLRKSGNNDFLKYKYFELEDFMPQVLKFSEELGIFSKFFVENNQAILEYQDCETGDTVRYSVPFVLAQLKGADPIQSLGASLTYLRRYLYICSLDIIERDVIDAQTPAEKEEPKEQETQLSDKKDNSVEDKVEKIRKTLSSMGLKYDITPDGVVVVYNCYQQKETLKRWGFSYNPELKAFVRKVANA